MMQEVTSENFDRYGFLVDEGSVATEENDFRSHEYSDESAMESPEYMDRYKKLLRRWKSASKAEIEGAVRRGIPNKLRGKAWQRMLDTAGARSHHAFDYAKGLEHVHRVRDSRLHAQDQADARRREWAMQYSASNKENAGAASGDDAAAAAAAASRPSAPNDDPLADDGQHPTAKALNQISLDLDRTFYTHKMFMEKGGEGQKKLFNVLATYALFNPTDGYCQGMAYIVAVLLMNMDEENAFWALVVLCGSERWLKGYYSESLVRVQNDAQVFGTLVMRRMPELGSHLASLCVHPLMYVTPWFMCAFTSLPCWDTVLAVWDMLMLHGSSTLFRVGLGIMETCKYEILDKEGLGELLPYLQHLPHRKMRKDFVMDNFWKIEQGLLTTQVASITSLVQRGLNSMSHITSSTPARNRKRPHGADYDVDDSQHSKRKAVEATPQHRAAASSAAESGSQAKAVPATPSAFRRFINSLATPLRQRVRDDGAKTPAPRPIARELAVESTEAAAAEESEVARAPSKRPAAITARRAIARTASGRSRNGRHGSPLRSGTPNKAGGALSPMQRVPSEARSPSFARSGVLSPSFRGNAEVMLSSPLQHKVKTHIQHAHLSPSENKIIATASPGERESFRVFKTQTPLRTTRSKSGQVAPCPGAARAAPAPAAAGRKQTAQDVQPESMELQVLSSSNRG